MKRTILGVSAMMAACAVHGQSTLQLIHASDLEGGVDAITNAPNFAAIIDALDDLNPDTLILSAGDNIIPGPFFGASSDPSIQPTLQAVYQDFFNEPGLNNIRAVNGIVDVSIMNIIGFDASALGNHEFDGGSDVLEKIIEEDVRGSNPGDIRGFGAQFPYLSSNLDFSADPDLGNLFSDYLVDGIRPNTDFDLTLAEALAGVNPDKISQVTTVDVNGEIYGVIGATTQRLNIISSPTGTIVVDQFGNPFTNEDMVVLAAQIQPIIDALEFAGIDKIIVVSHLQQIALEKQLAGLLDGVDIIIAGGSDTIQANAPVAGTLIGSLRPSDVAAEPYPFVTTDLATDPVVIVSTDGEYSYVGRLVVEFDATGTIVPASINTTVNDVNTLSGPIPTTDPAVVEFWGNLIDPFFNDPALGVFEEGALVQELTNAVSAVVAAKDGVVFGYTREFLNGDRGGVRTEETNLGNMTADSMLFGARTVDPNVVVAIKNGGGIRAVIGTIDSVTGEKLPPQQNPSAIPAKPFGAISQLDIENALRFNNTLVLMDLSGQDLLAILEHGVSATAPGATPGQFPQVGGLQFSYDPSQPAGSRVNAMALIDENGDITRELWRRGEGWDGSAQTDEFRIVTLNFLAGGGDGYPFPALGANDFNTGIGEQTALGDYLVANFPAPDLAYSEPDRAAQQDARIQDVGTARADADSVGLDIPVIPAGGVVLEPIATFESGVFDNSAAEIVGHDPLTQRLFVVSSDGSIVRVLDANPDPLNPAATGVAGLAQINSIAAPTVPAPGGVWVPNSCVVVDGVVYTCWADDGTTNPGVVTAHDTATLALIGNPVVVGNLPDMIAATPDGTKLVVCNEGEQVGTVNPEGSVSIIDISSGFASATVQTADFGRFDRRVSLLQNRGVLLTGIATGAAANLSEDVEPEYAVVTPDSRFAWVGLQEANAVALVDLNLGIVRNILPLGLINRGVPQFAMDFTNSDDTINVINVSSVFSPRQPDAIALVVGTNGLPYILTADEGDARDFEEIRVRDIGDPGEPAFDSSFNFAPFADAAAYQADTAVGRLNFNKVSSDLDGDGDIDAIVNYGGRTMSIYEASPFGRFRSIGTTGNNVEAYTASIFGTVFNSNNDDNTSFDSRSDDKAGEPEALAVGTAADGRTYAFLGLERQSALLVYDVTDPRSPIFQSYNSNRNFMVDADVAEAGDLGPEGIVFVPEAESPTGTDIIVVANEVSGTVTIWELTQGVQ